MTIRIICPAGAGSRSGNRTTATRWARILRVLGHRVSVATGYASERCDLLVAMHARRSFQSVRAFSSLHPRLPLIVALTGTDLYGDIRSSRRARRSLELATRLIVLQPLGVRELPRRLRPKVRVMYQSAAPLTKRAGRTGSFDVCVIANLRAVKDPLRAALAVRYLPPTSRIRVLHFRRAISEALGHKARAEAQRNPRYQWLGEQPHWQVRGALARSQLLVLSSRTEGGANVISEALAAEVPILATRIPGNMGLLGTRYPGMFPVGAAQALARLMWRAESNKKCYAELARACAQRAYLCRPEREHRAWAELLKEVAAAPRPGRQTTA